MMKRTIMIVFVILLCFTFCLSGCIYTNQEFKTINLNNGTLNIPKDWKYQNDDGQNGIFCNNILCAFKSESYPSFKEEIEFSEGSAESNAYSDEFKALYAISSTVLSNGSVIGEAAIKVEDKEEKLYFLEVSSSDQPELLWYILPNVHYDTVEAIAYSYDAK